MFEQAIERLLEGNRRFAASKPTFDESEARRIEVARKQEPFATIFGCVDSRVPPELLFDQGLGDLFVIRTAGQVMGRTVLGSLEFGVAELQIPLMVVLGHEHCGAVKAAIDALEGRREAAAELDYVLDALAPAVEAGKKAGGDVWVQAVRAQISLTVNRLRHWPYLRRAIAEDRLRIVGAWYNLETGLVEMTAD